MKTETKSKIKKALKVGAYVGGLMLALVLGMGFGSCSEKKLQGQASQKAEPRKLSPRLSYDDDLNLLDFGVEYSGLCAGSSSRNDVYMWGFRTTVIPSAYMPVGHTYVVTYDTGDMNVLKNDFGYTWCVGAISNSVVSHLQTSSAFENFDGSLAKWFSVANNDYSSPFSFYIPEGTYSGTGGAHIGSVSLCYRSNVTGLYMVDSSFVSDIPSKLDISFSRTSWFPYQLLGQNNSPVIAGPYNGGTMDTIEKGITNVLFTSNGRLFEGILFSFAPLAQVGSTASQQRHPSTYGYYNQDMTPIGTPQECHSDYLWYLAQVDYIPVGGGPFVYVGGQRMKQFSDSSQSVTQFFDWVDNRYADISIKWAGSAVNTEITTTSGLTNLQWLENIALSVFDNTVSLGGGSVDIFSLIGNGFSSITSILSIQILPYLTLGTLLLAPLVILLALAILKVLNK